MERKVQNVKKTPIQIINWKTSEHKLYGIICHCGKTPYGGHYITYILDDNENWYKVDDDIITKVIDISDMFTSVSQGFEETAVGLLYMNEKYVNDKSD